MSRPSDILGESILSRGIRVRPVGGTGRVSRGYNTLGSSTPADLDPAPLLNSENLLSPEIQEIRFSEVYRSPFWHPDREYTGYAANGYWYTNGDLDPTHEPYKATWAQEGEGDASTHRGAQDSFPKKILIVLTRLEAAIFDADSLTLWLRFSLPRSSPPGLGYFLGTGAAELRSVTFDNGILVVATSAGLRIANFRLDEAYAYRAVGSKKSTGGLVDRNTATYMDGSALVATISANNCYRVDSQNLAQPSGVEKRVTTVCACAHTAGFDGLVLWKSQSFTYPTVKKTPILRAITSAWSMGDDGDGDSKSSLFTDSGTNWEGIGVRPGDTLVTDTPSTHTIVEVAQAIPGSFLRIDPELDLTDSGANYAIYRGSRAVRVAMDGSLYAANGENSVALFATSSWYQDGSSLYSNLTTPYPAVRFAADAEQLNDLALDGSGGVYAATTLGIFYASSADLEGSGFAKLRYSTPSLLDVGAEYSVLSGEGTNCLAVCVDPETGNVLVSVVTDDGLASTVTEINPNIHHPFRFFDNVGVVRTFAAFRNPLGPPDEDP